MGNKTPINIVKDEIYTSISVTHQDSVLYMRMYEYKMLKDSLNVTDSDVTVLREVNI